MLGRSNEWYRTSRCYLKSRMKDQSFRGNIRQSAITNVIPHPFHGLSVHGCHLRAEVRTLRAPWGFVKRCRNHYTMLLLRLMIPVHPKLMLIHSDFDIRTPRSLKKRTISMIYSTITYVIVKFQILTT